MKQDLAFPYDTFDENHKGLTKREYIATKVLAGIVSVESIAKNNKNKVLVKVAIELTDELLKQLSE